MWVTLRSQRIKYDWFACARLKHYLVSVIPNMIMVSKLWWLIITANRWFDKRDKFMPQNLLKKYIMTSLRILFYQTLKINQAGDSEEIDGCVMCKHKNVTKFVSIIKIEKQCNTWTALSLFAFKWASSIEYSFTVWTCKWIIIHWNTKNSSCICNSRWCKIACLVSL